MQRLQSLLAEVAAFITEHDELLVVSASTLLCSLSHSALRPVLPVFAKVGLLQNTLSNMLMVLTDSQTTDMQTLTHFTQQTCLCPLPSQ